MYIEMGALCSTCSLCTTSNIYTTDMTIAQFIRSAKSNAVAYFSISTKVSFAKLRAWSPGLCVPNIQTG